MNFQAQTFYECILIDDFLRENFFIKTEWITKVCVSHSNRTLVYHL